MTFLTPRTPSPSQRLSVATVSAESALGLFTSALAQLDAAALDAEVIADELGDEVARLLALRNDAKAQAVVTQTRAAKFRALLA